MTVHAGEPFVPTRRLRWELLSGPVLTAIGYYLGAEAAFLIGTLSDKIFAPFWPPNVILFAALLLTPYRRWWLIFAAVLPIHILAELRIGMASTAIVVAFITNVQVAVMNAVAVRYFLVSPPWFSDVGKALRYILITVGVSPAIAALGGAFVPILGGAPVEHYWQLWAHWYSGNALACLTLGPIILTWFGDRRRVPPESTARRIETALAALGLGIVCIVAFNLSARTPYSGFVPALLYLPLPLVLWMAIRFGARGASAAILIVTVILVSHTLRGPSAFVADDPETNVLALQLFLTGLSVPVLLLGAVMDQLHRAEQTTRRLVGSVLKAQDDERRRIARELHDSTGQNLVVATFLASKLEKKLADRDDPTAKDLDDILKQSIQDLRTMSYLLHPPLLDEAGLTAALRSYADGFGQRSAITIETDLPDDLGRLPADMEIVLFRVVQEALTNVARHSGGSSARIRLHRETLWGAPHIVVTVEDKGRGMSGAPALANGRSRRAGVGLASMRERLYQVGGQLEIISTAAGTTIRAMVPLAKAA